MSTARSRWLACALFGLLSQAAWPETRPEDAAALRVKAQFVYNFTNYVSWPDDAFASAQAPVEVCLFGEVAFEPYLRSFEGVIIGERPLALRSSMQLDDVRQGCHLLFVDHAQRVRLPNFWDEIEYVYVLSVGERSEFADNGGIISIYRASDRLRFDVNISNAINNGLFLDSDLLSLARTIKRNTE